MSYNIHRLYKLSLLLIAVFISIALPTMPTTSYAQSKEVNINEFKAAWIYTIIDWLDWKTRPKGTLKVCTVGRDKVNSYLQDIKRDKKADFLILNKVPDDAFEECYILYISESEQNQYEDLLRKTKAHSVVTISSIKGFAKHGGMIEFEAGKKASLILNLTTANNAQITIDNDLRGMVKTIQYLEQKSG